MSETNVRVDPALELPALSLEVTVYVAGVLAVALHLKAVEVYGPPAGALTVSALCVVQLVADSAGNVADAGPEPLSLTVSMRLNWPAASDLK